MNDVRIAGRIAKLTARFSVLLLLSMTFDGVAEEAAIDFTKYIPPDTTIFVQIADLKQLQVDLQKSGLGKVWADPEIRTLTAPLRELQSSWFENYLHNLELERPAQERLFNRQLALFIGDVLPLGSGYTFEICLIAQRSGATEQEYKEFVERLTGATPERATRQSIEVEGVKIYQLKFNDKVYLINNEVFSQQEFDGQPEEYKQLAIKEEKFFERNIQYAFAGDVFLLSDGDDRTLAEIVRLLKNPQAESIASEPVYRNTSGGGATAPAARFYLNLRRINDYLNLREAELGEANPFKSLGLDQLQGLGFTLEQQQENLLLQGKLFCTAIERGYPALLNAFRDNPMSSLKIVPEAAVTFDTMVCDWGKLRDQIFALLEPETAQAIRQQLDAFKLVVQLDFENEFIRALGREIAVFTIDVGDRAQPAPYQVSVLEIKDRTAADNLLNKALSFNGLGETLQLEEIPFMGLTIQTAKPKDGGLAGNDLPYWVFTDQFFILADDPQPLRETIRVLRGEAPSIQNNANFIQSRKLLPADVAFFGWSDMTAVDEMIQAMLKDRATLDLIIPYFYGILDLKNPPQGPLFSRYLKSLVYGLSLASNGVELRMILNGKLEE